MNRVALCAAIILVLSAAGFSQQKSLYDRLGGQPAIDAVVKDFASGIMRKSLTLFV